VWVENVPGAVDREGSDYENVNFAKGQGIAAFVVAREPVYCAAEQE
jgi:hypothetical protein